MTTDRLTLGAAGESAACAHLERHGYRILARNARVGGVEIDVVAERRDVLVFVEVKTRRSARHGGAEEAVDARKRARLVRGAAAWLREHRPGHRRVRFDVIACDAADPRRGFRVRHWAGAFDAGDS